MRSRRARPSTGARRSELGRSRHGTLEETLEAHRRATEREFRAYIIRKSQEYGAHYFSNEGELGMLGGASRVLDNIPRQQSSIQVLGRHVRMQRSSRAQAILNEWRRRQILFDPSTGEVSDEEVQRARREEEATRKDRERRQEILDCHREKEKRRASIIQSGHGGLNFSHDYKPHERC